MGANNHYSNNQHHFKKSNSFKKKSYSKRFMKCNFFPKPRNSEKDYRKKKVQMSGTKLTEGQQGSINDSSIALVMRQQSTTSTVDQ